MNNYKEIEEAKKRIHNLCECRDEALKKELGEECYTKTFTDDFNIIDSYIDELEETVKKQAEYIKELEKGV